MREFVNLVQGNWIVEQYMNRFVELSGFAQEIVVNEDIKCRRFERGLREEIRMAVVGFRFNDFSRLVETAMRVEQCMPEKEKEEVPPRRQKRGDREWGTGGSKGRVPRRQGSYSGSSSGQASGASGGQSRFSGQSGSGS